MKFPIESMKIVLESYVYAESYLILKSKNLVKFYVHIRKPYFIMPGHRLFISSMQ